LANHFRLDRESLSDFSASLEYLRKSSSGYSSFTRLRMGLARFFKRKVVFLGVIEGNASAKKTTPCLA